MKAKLLITAASLLILSATGVSAGEQPDQKTHYKWVPRETKVLEWIDDQWVETQIIYNGYYEDGSYYGSTTIKPDYTLQTIYSYDSERRVTELRVFENTDIDLPPTTRYRYEYFTAPVTEYMPADRVSRLVERVYTANYDPATSKLGEEVESERNELSQAKQHQFSYNHFTRAFGKLTEPLFEDYFMHFDDYRNLAPSTIQCGTMRALSGSGGGIETEKHYYDFTNVTWKSFEEPFIALNDAINLTNPLPSSLLLTADLTRDKDTEADHYTYSYEKNRSTRTIDAADGSKSVLISKKLKRGKRTLEQVTANGHTKTTLTVEEYSAMGNLMMDYSISTTDGVFTQKNFFVEIGEEEDPISETSSVFQVYNRSSFMANTDKLDSDLSKYLDEDPDFTEYARVPRYRYLYNDFVQIPDLDWAPDDDDDDSSVTTVSVDTDAATEYFDLQGRRVMNPGRGIYIMRRGNDVIKIAH